MPSSSNRRCYFHEKALYFITLCFQVVSQVIEDHEIDFSICILAWLNLVHCGKLRFRGTKMSLGI